MASVGVILNDEFFGDVFDTPKEATEQCKKREELKSAIDEGKLGHKLKTKWLSWAVFLCIRLLTGLNLF